MPAEVVCSGCGRLLRGPDALAGQTGLCPACQTPNRFSENAESAASQPPAPHRGGLMLGLGLVGLLVCNLFGPVVWAMAASDLRAMTAGQMDPEGQGLTRAGYILGILGTVLLVLFVISMAVLGFYVVSMIEEMSTAVGA